MNRSHPETVTDALYSGDLKALEQYVSEDNVNVVDEEGHTLLSRAATATDLNMKIVRLLLKRGANANIHLREGWSLLHYAAHTLRKELAVVLLRAGCDPNAVDGVGQTPLSKVLFARNTKADLIELLLEHGADPDAKDGGGESAKELATRTSQIDLFPPR